MLGCLSQMQKNFQKGTYSNQSKPEQKRLLVFRVFRAGRALLAFATCRRGASHKSRAKFLHLRGEEERDATTGRGLLLPSVRRTEGVTRRRGVKEEEDEARRGEVVSRPSTNPKPQVTHCTSTKHKQQDEPHDAQIHLHWRR